MIVEIPNKLPTESLETSDVQWIAHKIGPEILINYSKTEQIKHEKIIAIRPSAIEDSREEIRGKIVLIGNVDESTSDNFNYPGKGLVPGILFHASAAYTLAAEPVYEFKSTYRLLLDACISIIMVGLVLMCKQFALKKDQKRFATAENSEEKIKAILERQESKIVALTFLFVLVSGGALVAWVNLLWLDFFLVAGALLLHRPVKKWLVKAFPR